MACIKKCMEWLTDYAFVYIAIYGISFIEAGLEVKDLVVSKGLDAIAQAISRRSPADLRRPPSSRISRRSPPPLPRADLADLAPAHPPRRHRADHAHRARLIPRQGELPTPPPPGPEPNGPAYR